MQLTGSFIYKIHKPFLSVTSCILFLSLSIRSYSQQKKLNRYGLHVTTSPAELKRIMKKDTTMAMPDLRKMIPNLLLDLKYSDTANFMNQRLYPAGTNTTYLRKPAALALARVQHQLNTKGFGLKIWDAYRPYSVTEKMWEPVKDDRYAADPKFGSGHNRGAAVDLTIVELASGKELNMGTGFDHFSDTAHVGFKELPSDVLQNRLLLQSLMEQQGFKILETEWWHFYLPDAKKYDLMDLSFKQLAKINRSIN